MRHAYLILAHNEFGLLQRLVSALDDARNDIYVHIDRRCQSLPELRTMKSELHVYSEVKVYWGDSSMLDAEFFLFKKAAEGKYDYYHLLSGVDFPVKSNDYIDSYCEARNGFAFLDSYHCPDGETADKMKVWHLFPHYFTNQSGSLFSFRRIMRALFNRGQRYLHLFRNQGVDFRKGAQWMSLPDEILRYLITKESYAKRIFTHTFCPDEYFVQTIIYDSPYRERAFANEWDGTGNARYIDWSGDNVKVLTMEDIEAIRKTDALFARKFSSEHSDVIDAIEQMIGE